MNLPPQPENESESRPLVHTARLLLCGCRGVPAFCVPAILLALLANTAFAVPTTRTEVVSTTCQFETPLLSPVGQLTRATVAGCDHWQQVGAPLLPFRTVRLLLPAGARVTSVRTVAISGISSLLVPSKIEFGRLPLRRASGRTIPAGSEAQDGPDPSIYESERLYPAAAAELASVQRLNGFDIAFVRVFPLQYLPVRNELQFAPELRVEVELTINSVQGSAAAPVARPGGLARVAAMIDNPTALTGLESSGSLLPGPQFGGENFDYLLITSSSLTNAFQPLVQLKTQQGLAVRVQTIEALTNTFQGVDVPERIRNCIRDAYLNMGVRYVLLGGDTTALPSRNAYVYMGLAEDPNLPTDMYYACLDGTWNYDADARWGEPTDGNGGGDVDLLAEVAVGRAPVDTVAEANTFVEKTIRYQTAAHPFLTNALFLAEVLNESQNPPAQGGDMFVPLEPFFTNYHVTWLDDRFTVPTWTREDALAAMNQSPHLVLFNGHGNDYTLIGVEDPFNRSIELPEIDSLANQYPFLAYSVGCDVGWFDNHKSLPDAIGEDLLKRHSRGAFAAVFNSRFGWYDPLDEAKYSGEFQLWFFANLLPGKMPNLGDANQFSKEDLLGKVEQTGIMTYRYCFYEITFFGDPHAVWRSAPAAPVQRQLLITSPHGGASPPAAAYSITNGASVTCQVTNSPSLGSAGLRYVCTGWTGTGSVPASGSTTQVTFVVTSDSQLTWLWKTQALLTVSAGANGTANGGGWFDLGTPNASATAVPAQYYHFVYWLGDVPAASASNAVLQLTMDRPRTVQANFAENLTSTGTPEWWLASFGWTNQFETASLADTDHDGMAASQEYVAGTDPTSHSSALRLVLSSPSGSSLQLAWSSVSGRLYSLWAATSPTGTFALITDNLAATPPTNVYTYTPGGEKRFFRLEVERVP